MSCTRLLFVALWFCCLPAFAQDHSLIAGKAGGNGQRILDLPPAATPSEPWRILPKPNSDRNQGLILITPDTLGLEGTLVSPDGPLAAGTICYNIRSYVVSRDSKDSDSVHPSGYSTCIPANRYRLNPENHDVVR